MPHPESPQFPAEGEITNSPIYRQLSLLLTEVRRTPHLANASLEGFIIHHHRFQRKKKGPKQLEPQKLFRKEPLLFPILSIPNPITPTTYEQTSAYLTYPQTGHIPEPAPPEEPSYKNNFRPQKVAYHTPRLIHFTLTPTLEPITIHRNPHAIVALWGGIHQPDVHQAVDYALVEVYPDSPPPQPFLDIQRAMILVEPNFQLPENPYTLTDVIDRLRLLQPDRQSQSLQALSRLIVPEENTPQLGLIPPPSDSVQL